MDTYSVAFKVIRHVIDNEFDFSFLLYNTYYIAFIFILIL